MGIPSAGASQTAQRNSMILNGSIDKVLLLIYYVSIMCTKGVSIMASEKRHRVVVYVNEELKLRAEKKSDQLDCRFRVYLMLQFRTT